MKLAAITLLLVSSGCVAARIDPYSTCQMLRDNPTLPDHASLRELAEMSRGTPAQATARNAYAQKLTITVLGVIGAAALVTGLVEGFVIDTGDNSAARYAGYGLVGGAVALGAAAMGLGITSGRTAAAARGELHTWAYSCRVRE